MQGHRADRKTRRYIRLKMELLASDQKYERKIPIKRTAVAVAANATTASGEIAVSIIGFSDGCGSKYITETTLFTPAAMTSQTYPDFNASVKI